MIAPQIIRVGLVFITFTMAFLGAKAILTPPGFGEAGFHRKDGEVKIGAAPIRHAGMAACADCHPDQAELTPHVKKHVRCESCHGAAEAHVKDWEKSKPFLPSTRADCTRCHAELISRPAWFPQIDPKTHNPETRCMDCHFVHPEAPAEPSSTTEGQS